MAYNTLSAEIATFSDTTAPPAVDYDENGSMDSLAKIDIKGNEAIGLAHRIAEDVARVEKQNLLEFPQAFMHLHAYVFEEAMAGRLQLGSAIEHESYDQQILRFTKEIVREAIDALASQPDLLDTIRKEHEDERNTLTAVIRDLRAQLEESKGQVSKAREPGLLLASKVQTLPLPQTLINTVLEESFSKDAMSDATIVEAPKLDETTFISTVQKTGNAALNTTVAVKA